MSARTPHPFLVFGFKTTHDALLAEDLLRDVDFDAVPVPTPKSLGSLCGVAIRVPFEQGNVARAELIAAGLPPASEAEIEDV